jgi:uncharacterized protein (DUF983 family)
MTLLTVIKDYPPMLLTLAAGALVAGGMAYVLFLQQAAPRWIAFGLWGLALFLEKNRKRKE